MAAPEDAEDVRDVWRFYQRHAGDYDRDRSRTLMELSYLTEVMNALPPQANILDLGCGMGEPIARYFIEQGMQVTGVDAAPAMLSISARRFPDATWIEADMRSLDLGRRFDAIVAWNSFFHLSVPDQREMFPVFSRHAAPGCMLLFTSGPEAGEAIGDLYGEKLFHASLSPQEYREQLNGAGFEVLRHKAEDPDCGRHTVWLARALS